MLILDDFAMRELTPAQADDLYELITVWRSVRVDGDTKTEKSRRTLKLPAQAEDALRTLHARQETDRKTAGATWRDHGLVFCTRVGTPLSAGNVRRSFRAITKAAKIGEDWTPRELRHSFVSIMSDNGVRLEAIADLVGHKNATVTGPGLPAPTQAHDHPGCRAMDTIFSQPKDVKSA